MDEITPANLVQRLLHGWWVIVVLMMIGGMLGYIAGKFLPPVYVARAEFFVSLNEILFAAEHKLEFVEYVDRKEPLAAVSDLLYSQDVISAVDAYVGERGIQLPDVPFGRQFRLDRYYTTWVFSVRHTNPEIAAELVNIWMETAYQVVQEAHQHAILYHQLSLEMAGLDSCFSNDNLLAGNLCAGTSFASLAEMLVYLEDLSGRLLAEQDASHGMSYATRFEIVHLADIPAEPSRNSIGILILTGCFLGWLVGLVLVFQGRKIRLRR